MVLNATGFSARRDEAGSPLDAAGVPVLQLVLAGVGPRGVAASSRGLSQADLAMQVVLPELDGRLLTAAISFKAEGEPRARPRVRPRRAPPDPDGMALAADRAAGWVRLAPHRGARSGGWRSCCRTIRARWAARPRGRARQLRQPGRDLLG